MRRKLKIDNSRIIILLIHNETILFIRKNLPRKSPIQFKLFTFWKFQIQKLQFQTFFENSNWPRSRIFWMGHFYLVQGHSSLQLIGRKRNFLFCRTCKIFVMPCLISDLINGKNSKWFSIQKAGITSKRFRIQINFVLRLSKCGFNGSKNSNCKTRLASKSFWYNQKTRYHLVSFKSINYGRLVSLNLSHSIFTPWIISKWLQCAPKIMITSQNFWLRSRSPG